MAEMKISGVEASKSLKEAKESGIDEVLFKTLHDPDIKKLISSLSLTEKDVAENLPLFLSYQEDLSYCSHCPGMDKCAKAIPLSTSSIAMENGALTRGFGPCSLYKDKQQLEKAFLVRDYRDEWLSLSTTRVTPKTKRVISVFSSLNQPLVDDSKPWVYMIGEEGSGKSYLLVAYINGLALQGASIAYLDSNKRLDELKSLAISNKKAFQSKMDELEGCDILVLDNFGSEFKSDYLRDQIVMPLLSERSRHKRVTYFASTYSLDDIKTLYATSRAGEIAAKQLYELITRNIKSPLLVTKGFDSFLS